MRLPGSTQLAHAKRFLLTVPWHRLAPVTNLFTGATSAARSIDGQCALAYAITGKPMTVDLAALGGSATVRWFDPTSGEFKSVEAPPSATQGKREFTPPGKNAAGDTDWVLVVESAGAPGSAPPK
jgi:hypothetical protein